MLPNWHNIISAFSTSPQALISNLQFHLFFLLGVKYFMALCRAARPYTVGSQCLVDEDLAENTEGWCGHAVALKPHFEISKSHWSCQQRWGYSRAGNLHKQSFADGWHIVLVENVCILSNYGVFEQLGHCWKFHSKNGYYAKIKSLTNFSAAVIVNYKIQYGPYTSSKELMEL